MARSATNQQFLLQAEVTPGTPLVNAMKRLLGLKAMPATRNTGYQSFKAAGHKVSTSGQIGDLLGAWTVEGIQDFNAIGFALNSLIGPADITTPGGATNARQSVFTSDPDGADIKKTYTAQYGDTTKAFQSAYAVFNNLNLGIQRGQLSLTSALLSKKPDPGATLATVGVTDVASIPMPTRKYDIYADDAWADLGDTKLLAIYEASFAHGDKYVPDAPINSAIDGFEDLLEAEDITYGGSIRAGFDAAGEGLIDTFENEAIKFLRYEVIGPIIEAAIAYSFQLDMAVRLTNVGEVGKAPNSPAVSLPFDYELIKDPTSGSFLQATLINTMAAY